MSDGPAIATTPRLPRILAWTTVIATVPLILIGGTVTTLRVGMAVPDWPTTFGENMFTYPLSEMLANMAVFWEHSHRLWASGVGFLVILTGLATWLTKTSASAKWMAAVALVAVSGQGVVGGLRVRENAPELAFLHGSIAQLVFAVFVALAVLLAPNWRTVERRAHDVASSLRFWAVATCMFIYVQIVVGAWLRHSGSHAALGVHVVLVLGVVASVIMLARCLAKSGEPILMRAKRRLHILLWSQILLGGISTVAVLVFSGGFMERPSQLEQVFATLHVAVGALLFVSSVASAMWSYRLIGRPGGATVGSPVEVPA